ncbi:MAG TPA: hypothetical protein VK188_12470 [Holophaga sp.]|nr:hypothetical protein [Holophaga sp.]
MRIANPIYDVVFKYLLDDGKVARILLGALLGREILDLQFRPTEVHHEAGTSLLVLRMDFAATLRLEDGSRKLVLIEIQKAHNAMDVMRFRRYLGSQYANGENVYPGPGGTELPLPIVTIYFLGEGLDGVDAPVLRINRHYRDVATGEDLPIADPFVEALTHDSIVVQMDRLGGRRRTDLERLLAVFDQDRAARSDPHLLDILEENFPERYQEVLRRLIRAGAEPKVRDGMDVEDDVVSFIQSSERRTADARAEALRIREELAAKDRALEDKDRVLADKDRVLAEMAREMEALRRRLPGGSGA